LDAQGVEAATRAGGPEAGDGSEMPCPRCVAGVELEAQRCPACAADLREYAYLYYRPAALFNDALELMESGQAAEAAALLAEVCSLRPWDVEALTLWADACLARGDGAEAARIVLLARERAPSEELDGRYVEALHLLEVGGGAGAAALVDVAGRLRVEVEALGKSLRLVEWVLDRLPHPSGP
jgi:predicted Zn-dependent protease